MSFACLALLLAGCAPGDASPRVADPLDLAANPGSSTPNLAIDPDGNAVLSWLEPSPGGSTLRFASMAAPSMSHSGAAERWSIPGTVASGTDWLVNWADFPSVVPLSTSFWAAHWLVRQTDNPYAYDIAVAVSNDGGTTWLDPITPHQDGTATEHGFVSLVPTAGGGQVLWLDGRATTREGGAMALRSATLAEDGTIQSSEVLDERVCDCCQTDVAIATSGPVAVYRNRSDGEIRDIYNIRFSNGSWEEAHPVAIDDWKITGCPINGPAIAADGERVAVAWYTGAGVPTIRLAVSADSAASFAAPIDVADGAVMGRVGVALLEEGAAAVSWVENRRRKDGTVVAEIRVRRVTAAGASQTSHLVAETGTGQPAGFPQMIRQGERLLFAWTDTLAADSQVRSAQVPVAVLF